MTNMGDLQEWFQRHYLAEMDPKHIEEMRIPGPTDALNRMRFGVSMGYAGQQIRVRAMLDRNWCAWLDLPTKGEWHEDGARAFQVRSMMQDALGLDGNRWSMNPNANRRAKPIHFLALRYLGADTAPQVVQKRAEGVIV